MIPPFLATKAAELLAPVAAKFASPLVKWGTVAGIVVALMVATWWKTYDSMRSACEEEKIAAIQASVEAERTNGHAQLLAERELNKQVFEAGERKAAEIQAVLDDTRKKARKYAHVTMQVPVDLLHVHDRYAGMSVGSSDHPAGTDPSASRPQVPSGPLSAQTDQRVSVELGELGTVEMTVENAVNMLTDVYDTLRRVEKDYAKFSRWNDGREDIELNLVKKGQP